MTSKLSFFTPVDYDKRSFLEIVDNYFYLGGKRAHVTRQTSDGKEFVILSMGKSSLLVKIAKIASYLTIIIPIVMLSIKAVLRFRHNFIVIDPKQNLETKKTYGADDGLVLTLEGKDILLPNEVSQHILSFLKPSNMSSKKVKKSSKDIRNLSMVNGAFHSICSEQLRDLEQISYLIRKYSQFNSEYERKVAQGEHDPNVRPQLLNALLSGYKYADRTFDTYIDDTGKDIQTIVKLMPKSLHYTCSEIRCRSAMPPLAVACFNPNIPICIIEFLLVNGADPNITYLCANDDASILYDLHDQLPQKVDEEKNRMIAICKLLEKHRAQSLFRTSLDRSAGKAMSVV